MKKILTITVVVLSMHSIVRAQMKKGSILLGGDISFSSQKTADSSIANSPAKNNSFYFNPSVAIALRDNFFAGIRLSYGHSSEAAFTSNGEFVNQKSNSYGGSVFLRQYKTLSGRFNFFLEESLAAAGSKTTYQPLTSEGNMVNKTFFAGVGVSPGVAWSATPHFQLETGLQNVFYFNYQRDTFVGGDHSNSLRAGTAFNQVFDNLYLGAKFLFGN